MQRPGTLSLAQRIVLVVALALALAVLGRYLVSLGGGPFARYFGSVAHAPLASPGLAYLGLRPWLRLVVWLGLIALWAVASVRLLRPGR